MSRYRSARNYLCGTLAAPRSPARANCGAVRSGIVFLDAKQLRYRPPFPLRPDLDSSGRKPSSRVMASLLPLRLDPDSSYRDAKKLRDGQPLATAAWPGLVLSRRQAAGRWPVFATAARPGRVRTGRQAAKKWMAVCHCSSARALLVWRRSSSEIASRVPLRLGPDTSCRDAKQLRDGQLPAAAARPGLVLSGSCRLHPSEFQF